MARTPRVSISERQNGNINVRLETEHWDRLRRIQAHLASEGFEATPSAALRYALFKTEIGLPPLRRRVEEQSTAAE